MRDQRLLGVTMALSLVVGAAAAFSIDPGEARKLRYPFIHTSSGKVFEAEIQGRFQNDFDRLLNKDPSVLGLQTRTASVEAALPQYYLLGVQEHREVIPYIERFLRGFVFIWMVYFVTRALVNALIVKEYKRSITKRRRKPRKRR